MMKNFKITLEYDGTNYHGWQRQKNQASIQAEIERALAAITRKPVTVIGSGRTDAGVHALGQVANFTCDTRLEVEALHKGLNSLLPDDIVIRDCRQVASAFHARYDAKSKLYHYHILNRPVPAAIGRQYCWHVRKPLDTSAMKAAAAHLIGTHDFKAFEGAGSRRAHSRRTVMLSELDKKEAGCLVFRIAADGFLRFMVRNIVGTLVDVGWRKITPADFQQILAGGDRARAGATAPARGLCLMQVNY